MADFPQRLKQRKLVQWALAYLAAAWVVLQALDLAVDSYGWSRQVMQVAFGLIAVGFVVALILAWYHGERGAQRVSGMELLIVALVLAVGGGLLWHFAREPAQGVTTNAAAQINASVRGAMAAARSPAATPTATATAAKATSTLTLAAPIAAQPIPAKSVAVLPFENLSTDKGNAYFADGMQDLILTKLADIGDLKVISRTSTMKYASHPEDLKTVGQQLGVATILEGSVQKAGNQVLINVQLIDAKTDNHLWAESYTRTLDNIFGVEGEVAEKIADALKAKLSSAEAASLAAVPTRDPQAYDAFLRGEYYCQRGESEFSETDYQTGFGHYRKAVAKSPDFALAWAQLANCQLVHLHFFGNDNSDLVVQAKAALDRALALQPQLEEAYVAKGQYLLFAKFDLTGAARAFAKAHALKPQDWLPIFLSGVIKEAQGHLDAAIEAFQHASALNPRATTPLIEIAFDYAQERRYAQAERAYQRPLAIDPSSLSATTGLAEAYELSGNLDAAGTVFDAAPGGSKSGPVFMLARARYLILRRDWVAARATLLQVQAAAPQPDWKVECALGNVERLAGDPDKARLYYQRCADLLPNAPQHGRGGGGAQPGDLGLALVHLGQNPQALAEGQRGLAKYPSSSSALLLMAMIEAQAGLAKSAVTMLNRLFSVWDSGLYVSVPLLKIDPVWDPIRHDPRFQALLKKYAQAGSAAAASGSGHD